MATEIKLPRLGQGMESGTIVKWLKSEGDRVQKGEPLYELDTDKVTQEVEADASGVLLKIAVAEGEVPVGRTIAVIGEQGEEAAVASPEAEQTRAADEEAAKTAEKPARAPAREAERERGREASSDGVTEIQRPVADRTDGRIKASPLARRIARERGVDLASVAGTGPEGRVVAEDVERAAAGAPTAAPAPAAALPSDRLLQAGEEVQVEQLSSMRRTIARRLTEAWQAPVFQLGVAADMERAQSVRARLVELNADGAKPTLSDLLTKVCAAALMRHRGVNALYTGDAIELHSTASIGIAVAIPNGLVVPVIHSAERLSVQEIANVRADLVDRARSGKLQQRDLDGGTFTISNLGMFGIERFIAVLNPPQSAILAVGSVEDKVVAVDGQPAVRPRMELTLTCDHRAIDGATGAQFLTTVKSFVEEPGLAL
jgi:pyruvate dehydrogenase E2 component (dihydrolipoamide acetyltransferase)